MIKMAGGEFNRTEFNPEYEFNCEKFKRVVGKKNFLPNIRNEIRKEIDSLKASLLDLKKGSTKLESTCPKFYFKEIRHCDIDDQGRKRTQLRREKPN